MKIYVDAYLLKNLGDDLFVNILTNRYPQHKFYAITKGIKEYKKQNLKIMSNSYIFRAVKKFQSEKYLANLCDAVVTIGGSMYMEKKGFKRKFSLGKKKHFILGTNFGPYQTQEFYNDVHDLFKNAEDVCFREKYTYDLFSDLSNVRYKPDIVFSLDTKNIKLTNRKRAIISFISCSYKLDDKYTKMYNEKMYELVRFLMKNEYEVCLMSFCKDEKDEDAINDFLEICDDEIKDKIETYFYDGNIEEALNVIGDSELVVGSRFHANIIGLALGKSIIPVIYSDKTLHVLDDLNIDVKCIDIRKLDDFDISCLNKSDLEKKYEIDKYKVEAEKHFEKLDKFLGKEN